MIFWQKLQLVGLAIALAISLPLVTLAENQYGWVVQGVTNWSSPDSVVSIKLDPTQAASITPQPVPDLPTPWQSLTSAYILSTNVPITSLTIRPSEPIEDYTAMLVQLPDGTWKELKTTLGFKGQRTVSHPGSATLVLASRDDWQQGEASWYKYKGCPCAASTQYPKGSKLIVTRADAPEKTMIVTVNDYGPEAWTGRIIDLDVTVFKKLGNKRAGVMTVTVKPL